MRSNTIKRMRKIEADLVDDKEALFSWLQKSLSRSKIKSLIGIAADLMPVPGDLDAHRHLLNTRNWVVDLRNGQLLKHNPKLYITKLAPIIYDPQALCERFLEFINLAFSGNQQHIEYFQKLIGYSLTGEVSEKILVVFWGPNGNEGKSCFANIFRGILGSDYCVNIASDSLTSGRQHVRSDVGRLDDKQRYATSSETDKAFKFNQSLIKEMTGDDVITARRLNSNEREFRIEFKLFLSTNHIPEFNLSDPAMADRVIVIPFRNPIPRDKQIRNFAKTLVEEEGPGILRWAVEGAVRWYAEGLGPVPFNQAELRRLIPVPTVKEFVEKHCEVDAPKPSKTKDLYEAYKVYHAELGCKYEPISETAFGIHLNSLGFPVDHREDGNYRKGLALKPAPAEVTERAEGSSQ